jgi:beta-glucosidase
VEFKLESRDLQMLNRDMHWVVEPGVFDIMVGPSSDQTTSVPLLVVTK